MVFVLCTESSLQKQLDVFFCIILLNTVWEKRTTRIGDDVVKCSADGQSLIIIELVMELCCLENTILSSVTADTNSVLAHLWYFAPKMIDDVIDIQVLGRATW